MGIKKFLKFFAKRVDVYLITFDASKVLVGAFFIEYWKLLKYFYDLIFKKDKKDNWEYRR